MPVSTSAISIPKEIFLEMSGFREDILMWEDSDLWGKIALKYPIAFSWEAVSIYHMEADNRTCDKTLLLEEHPFKSTAIKKIRDGDVPIEISDYLQEYFNLLNIHFAIRNIYIGDRKKALTILLHTKTRLLYQRKIFYLMLALIPTSMLYLLIKIKRSLEKSTYFSFFSI